MKTELITIKDIAAQAADFERAAAVLCEGGLVAFPTETVYGLGADGLNITAVKKIYSAKGRPSDNPLILHVCDMAMLERLVVSVSPLVEKLSAAFWPGPMTLVLPRRDTVPDQVTGGLDTVGIRMPDHRAALALIQAAGTPLAAPSANTSGRPSPTTAETVLADLAGKIEMILDGGSCRFGLESTILDCTGAVPIILRPGAITPEMVRSVAGDVLIDAALNDQAAIPKAPGMKYVHYAPEAPMVMLVGDSAVLSAAMLSEICRAEQAGKRVGVIVSEELAAHIPDHIVRSVYGKREDLSSIAAHLYTALRYFDTQPVDVIFAEGTTAEGLGMAVMNRLQKACGYRIIQV